jgi:hypothetical protein
MTIQSTMAAPGRLHTGGPSGLGAKLMRVFEILAATSDAARCAREAERLLAKSDEELARLGLRRDEVVRHAFARFMYI